MTNEKRQKHTILKYMHSIGHYNVVAMLKWRKHFYFSQNNEKDFFL